MPDAAGGILRETADMHLIDDQVLQRELKGLVALPVVVLADDLAPVNEACACFRKPAPHAPAGYRFGIGIQDRLSRIKILPRGRVPDPVEAVAVLGRLDLDPEDHHGVDIADAEFLREGDLDKGLRITVMVEQQGAACRFFGKNTEVDAAVHDGGTKGQDPPDPVF